MAKELKHECSECLSFQLQNYEACRILKDKQGDAWVYPIGRCTNCQSDHFGKVKLPGWKVCYMYKNGETIKTDTKEQRSIYDI